MSEIKQVGRPKIHRDPQERVKAYRSKQEGRRLDLYVSSSTSWRLKKLAYTWELSIAGVVERLTIEADEKYRDILFPETKLEETGF